jgi:hypothetical protein
MEEEMKRFLFVALIAVILSFSQNAKATLVDNGGGLIYDTALNITWYDSRYPTFGTASWWDANDWVQSLNIGRVSGWRLPNTGPVNGVSFSYAGSYNGSTDTAWNISAPGSAYPGSTGSEMAHLFYTTLGNQAYYDLNGNIQNSGNYSYLNKAPFTNEYGLGGLLYACWSNQTGRPGVGDAFYFSFTGGRQETGLLTTGSFQAIAVHDGNIGPDGPISTVPVPPALWLLGSGLAGLMGVRKWFTT